jgi:hypothetical protein
MISRHRLRRGHPDTPRWVEPDCKSLELFDQTNEFDAIDGILGNNPTFYLTS